MPKGHSTIIILSFIVILLFTMAFMTAKAIPPALASSVVLSESEITIIAGTPGAEVFFVHANSDVRNMTITLSSNLNALVNATTPGDASTIKAGDLTYVLIQYSGNPAVVNNGRVNVMWIDENGSPDTAYVTIRIIEKEQTASPLRWIGRITGIASLGFLAASIGLGMVKIGKERRVRLHCAISWFLLAISIYHGVTLVAGPYASLALETNLVIGWISALSMGIASVNGLVEKWMTKITSHRTWLWIHRITLITALALGIFHGVMLGTDFLFLRNLLG